MLFDQCLNNDVLIKTIVFSPRSESDETNEASWLYQVTHCALWHLRAADHASIIDDLAFLTKLYRAALFMLLCFGLCESISPLLLYLLQQLAKELVSKNKMASVMKAW